MQYIKILQRHRCISINRQFISTMENNFAGKRACSFSYPGAWVRYIESNTGESTRQGNLRHPRVRFQSFSLRGLPSQRTNVILPKGVGDFHILYFFRCLILFLTKSPNCFCLHSIKRFPAIYFSIAEVNIRFIHMQPYLGSISNVFHHKVQCI